jgi:hypothetical protein
VIIERLVAVSERLPTWLRPAFFGAVILVVIVSLRAVIRLPLILKQPEQLGELVLVLLGAAAAGALGGFGYTLLGAPARRIPVVGAYVAGVVTITAYMLGCLLLFTFIIPDEPLIENSTDIIIFAVVTLFFGLLAGHFWFRDEVR